jgi:response regulator of citrate/malate metabolism
MNVLIIDDDQEDALIFCEVMESVAPRLKCLAFHSYKDVQEVLQENDAPQFIFLDAYMYPLGGKECLVMLSKMEKLAGTKIIIHSGALSQSQIDEFYKLGADQVLLKSSNYESLRTSLKSILSV